MDVMGQGKGLTALLHFCHFELKCDPGRSSGEEEKEMDKMYAAGKKRAKVRRGEAGRLDLIADDTPPPTILDYSSLKPVSPLSTFSPSPSILSQLPAQLPGTPPHTDRFHLSSQIVLPKIMQYSEGARVL